MTNHVTPQTATRLREQGFPQPVPAPGQVWYTANDTPFVIAHDYDGSNFLLVWLDDESGLGEVTKSALLSCTYAPTAPDILRELGEEWVLSTADRQWHCDNTYKQRLFAKSLVFSNNNPAEACAMAWEAKQSKK